MITKWIAALGIFVVIVACAQKSSDSTSAEPDGQAIYKKYCILCHGADGKLGLNGAKDITQTILTEAEVIELVKNGKNTMTPFKGILTDEEIKAVVAYTRTLKN